MKQGDDCRFYKIPSQASGAINTPWDKGCMARRPSLTERLYTL